MAGDATKRFNLAMPLFKGETSWPDSPEADDYKVSDALADAFADSPF